MMQFGAGQQKGKKVPSGNKDALLIRPSGRTQGYESSRPLEGALAERLVQSGYVRILRN